MATRKIGKFPRKPTRRRRSSEEDDSLVTPKYLIKILEYRCYHQVHIIDQKMELWSILDIIIHENKLKKFPPIIINSCSFLNVRETE